MPLTSKSFKASVARAQRVTTGHYQVETTVTDNPTKEVRYAKNSQGRFTGLLDKYTAQAKKAGVSLDTMMRTLPRGSLSMESVFSEDYKSVKVRVGMEMTFPDFDSPTAKAMYEDMAQKIEYVIAQNLKEAREAAGI